MYNFRTDMADERKDIYKKANKLENIPGIETSENIISDNIKTNIVKIIDSQGEQAIGKPIGTYVTVDIKNLKLATDEDIQKASDVVKDELKKIIDTHCESQDEILVVGLGNQFVTPDSLGPKVVAEIDVTKHFIKYTPQYVTEGTRSVCAIAPGVLGTTGIETVEIVRGIVDNIKPKLVIAIDSLCSKNIDRINKSIQISDTGIVPGGGVGNKQQELSERTLNIPVIGVGIPTVLDAATIVIDTLDVCDISVSENEIVDKMQLNNFNFIVTPKEIDSLIDSMTNIVSEGINMCI